MHLYTDEGDIDTTSNHPFYAIGKGWVAAGDLVDGDEVYNLDGSTSIVIGSEIEVLDEPVLVYNLEVDDLHSYFVGCVPVLVHNVCKPRNTEQPQYKKPVSGKTGKEKASDIPSWAKGYRPYTNENGNDFAKRMMEMRYPDIKSPYKGKRKTEYNQLRKWGDRGFE